MGGPTGMSRFSAPPVSGAPLQAVTIIESTQILADGNKVASKQTGKVYRDTQGRTRTESTMRNFGPFRAQGVAVNMVTIDDPVTKEHIMLDHARKTATKTAMQVRPTDQRRPGPEQGDAKSDFPTEDLGTQVMEGVTVKGTRRTVTIAAGALGNDKPISIVTETWYSPDLQMVVMRKHSDPRSGEASFRMTEIQRTEPDASLFQVPADYTVTMPRSNRRTAPPAPPNQQ